MAERGEENSDIELDKTMDEETCEAETASVRAVAAQEGQEQQQGDMDDNMATWIQRVQKMK
jgi:hypothetical protein